MMHSEEQFGHIFITVHFEISYPGCFEIQVCELWVLFFFLRKCIIVLYLAYHSAMRAHGTRCLTQNRCFAASNGL